MKKMFEEENSDKETKVTFFSLLFESIVGVFLSGTEDSEEHNEYSTKEKWKIWAKNTFSQDCSARRGNKFVKTIIKFIVVFVIVNMFIFIPMVVAQLKSPRFPVARAYLKSSFMMNQLYIIPLSKMFGYGNPLTWGFYPIKDGLYKIGMSKFPKDEGEREISWFNIRFVEYKTVVQPALMDSYTYNDRTYKPLPTWQVKSLKKWHDELYSHILSWPNAKISDPTYKKEKLMRFVDLAEAYVDSTSVMSTKLQITKYNTGAKSTKNFPGGHLPYAKPEDVKNYMKIINVFNKLKTDSAKDDKDSYDYFKKNKRYYEDKFLYEAALDLKQSKYQWGHLSCNSPEVNFFVTQHKNLRDYYVENYNDLKPGEKGTIELLVTLGGLSEKCKNEPSLSEFYRYEKRYSNSFKHSMTMIEIFEDK